MKKRLIALLLVLVTVLGMLPALASVADAAANSWARWNKFVLEWIALDHFSYRVDIYMKDPATNNNVQLSTGCFTTIGRTNCEIFIADALIKYGLDSAEFGYGRGMRHSSDPDDVSEYAPTGFKRFYLSDFITMSVNPIWIYPDVLYVGKDYSRRRCPFGNHHQLGLRKPAIPWRSAMTRALPVWHLPLSAIWTMCRS